MIRLLRFIITGDWHLHEWEKIQEVDIYSIYDDGSTSTRPTKTEYHCKCIKCGKIKNFKMKY